MPNPLAIGVTLGGLLLDIVAPRPKPRAGIATESLSSERAASRTSWRSTSGTTTVRRSRAVGAAVGTVSRLPALRRQRRPRYRGPGVTTFAVKFLGCKVSQADAMLARQALLAAGHTEVPEADAELHVINTCCITREAEAKSRQSVRRSLSSAGRVYVAGCAVEPQRRASSPRSTRA